MNSHSDNNSRSTPLAKLESAIAHQQHAYDGLNAVVIEQAKMIEALQRRLKKLESALEATPYQTPSEQRDVVAEKPPHY